MINAFIFNLDGPLIQMDIVRAESFSRAVIELGNGEIREKDVVDIYREISHLSRFEIIQELIGKFNLKDSALAEMDKFGVSTPWQAFAQVRMEQYETMLNDPLVILKNYCPQSLDLLLWARQKKYKVGLTSGLAYSLTIKSIHLLDISFEFDFIICRDDVSNIKPDPELNYTIASQLETDPSKCVVIEDSLAGIKAAISAGMKCICVVNDFNRKMVTETYLLNQDVVLVSPDKLKEYVNNMDR